MATKRNVFLCHASEDKQPVVRPLRDALIAAGITCWLDEAEVHWGDSIVDKVTLGLRDSNFVVVVLSKAFVSKPWPRRELASALSMELSTGAVRVLPLIVGYPEEREFILQNLPLLHDKLHLGWDGDARPVVAALERRLAASGEPTLKRIQHAGGSRGSRPYCVRCGGTTGTPTLCIGGYAHHSFIQGTGQEFCVRCGASTGHVSDCTGGYVHHTFVQGTGNEFCIRCGAETGSASECTAGYVHHTFIQKPR